MIKLTWAVLLIALTCAADCKMPICIIESFEWPRYPAMGTSGALEAKVGVTVSIDSTSRALVIEGFTDDSLPLFRAVVVASLKGKKARPDCGVERFGIIYEFRLRKDQRDLGIKNYFEPKNRVIIEAYRRTPYAI